jgi:hypothetical protein
MHVSITHMDSGLKGLSEISQAEVCLVEADEPFLVTTRFPTNVTNTPVVVSVEGTGKYASIFLFWRDQRVFLTYHQRGKPVICSLQLKNHTPVVERRGDDIAFDIRRGAFPWSFQV